MASRWLFALFALLLNASAPVWSADGEDAAWLARINDIRELKDDAAAQSATAELAKTMPAERSPTLEYQWLSLQLAMAAKREDSDQVTALTAALLAFADQSGMIEARIEGLIYRAGELKDSGKPEEGLELAREALALLANVTDLRLQYLTHNRAAL